MKTTKLFFMAALALMTAACSNDDNDITTPEHSNNMITITAKLAPKSDAQTRAVSDDGTNIVVDWAENEQLEIISDNGYTATATITDVTGGVATISFSIDANADGQNCTIVYPASAATTTGVKDYATLLSTQDGTLSTNLDVRVGAGTIQTTTPGLTVTTQPAAQYAIFKFTLSGVCIDDTHPLVIKDGSENIITKVTPASTATSVYAAMPAAASSTYKFIVTTADNKYIKSGTAAITAGNYYQTTLAMTARYPLAMANATVDDLGSVIASDGNIYLTKTATPGSNTASGIIAYVGSAGSVDTSTSVDANCSTYKGLAIALTDANSGNKCQWYTANEGSCVNTGDYNVPLNYNSGIAYTNTLAGGCGASHEHAAASAAKNFSTTRPSAASVWFLPSIGQWNLIVQGLATKKSRSTVSTDLTTLSNAYYTDGNLNRVITDAGGTRFQSDRYWSSARDGYYDGHAWNMALIGGFAGRTYMNYNYYVRAVFAF